MRFRLGAGLLLAVSLITASLVASAQNNGEYQDFATDEFHEVWERTDRPVLEQLTDRTWMWGPGANTGLLQEPYEEADDGFRDVQYTDKSRMEMPWSDDADPNSPWFITQGLLATELMTGKVQVGDNAFIDAFPAQIRVAGDPDDLYGPSYETMGWFMDADPRSEGNVITDVITVDGSQFSNPDLAVYNATDEYWIQETGFYVASPFWAFMTSSGPIYEDGILQQGQIVPSPFYAVGFPKTPAFWSWVKVNNVEQNVLIQCFERRCLTYTPDNPEGWEVESGNVGQHYYHWRYEQVGDIDDGVTDDDVADDDVTDDTDDGVSDDDDADDGVDDADPPATPASFSVSPETSTNLVGSSHEITVTVLGDDDEPFEGADVSAIVTEGPHLNTGLSPQIATTGDDGIATLSYVGAATGEDTITVTVAGIDDAQTVTKIWADYVIELDPEDAENLVGSSYLLTATLVDSDGTVELEDDADFSVEISRTDDDGTDDFDDFATDINQDGEIEIAYDGPTAPATDTITVTITVDVGGVDEDFSASTTKTWVPYTLTLEHDDAENVIGSSHTFTATLTGLDDDEVDFDDDDLSISITRAFDDDSPDQSLGNAHMDSINVNANVATVSYDGPDDPAVDTIDATVTVDTAAGPVVVSATDTLTKTWVDMIVTVTPLSATNPYYGLFQFDPLGGDEVHSLNYMQMLVLIEAADTLGITDFDVDAFALETYMQDVSDGALINWEDVLDEVLSDSNDVAALLDALDDAGLNQHTVTVDVTLPSGSGVDEVQVEVFHEADDTAFHSEMLTVVDDEVSEDVTYTAEGVGFDHVVVTAGGVQREFNDVKEWTEQPTVTDEGMSLAPESAGPNPVGATHNVTATLTANDGTTPVDDALVSLNINAGPNVGQLMSGMTDGNGTVTISYVGEGDNLGVFGDEDLIGGWAFYTDTDGNLTIVTLEVDDFVTKSWCHTVSAGDLIQDAVDAALPGQSVCVEAGTYDEEVVINKEGLTLWSLDGAEETTITSSTTHDNGVVFVAASNVTVDGFTIDNQNAANGRAIRVMGTTENSTLINNILDNSFRGVQGDYQSGGDRSVNGLTISNNEINTDLGLAGTEEVTGLDIQSNTFNTSIEGIGLGEGVGIESIESNHFAGDGDHIRDYRATPDFGLLEGVLANNTFDRAVVVRDNPIVVPAIFSSIQDAVDEASSGEIVDVMPGTYEELVNVDVEGLSLLGAGIGESIIDGPALAQPTGTIEIHADNVTVQGFSVIKQGSQQNIETVGIGDGFGGTVLRDLDVSAPDYDVSVGGQPVLGHLNFSNPIGEITIDNVTTDRAIGLSLLAGADVTIINSTVTASNTEGIWLIWASNAAGDVVISGNDVQGSYAGGGSGADIILHGAVPGSVNNTDVAANALLAASIIFCDNDVASARVLNETSTACP